ncbi:MAG: hypothetical protein U9N14_06990 [Pseudomonadota bacterium]|nr:hypothetical protein [Pseudomonadota bacterium]
MAIWINDRSADSFSLRFRVDNPVVEVATDAHSAIVIDNDRFGRLLILDGRLAATERGDVPLFEMLAHAPILAHGAVRRVWVTGDPSGTLSRRLLMHDLTEVVRIAPDECLDKLARDHLAALAGDVFADKRLTVATTDLHQWLNRASGGFELAVSGPNAPTLTQETVLSVKDTLNPGGLLVAALGQPDADPTILTDSYQMLREMFVNVEFARIACPARAGGEIALAFATDTKGLICPGTARLFARLRAAKVNVTVYTPEWHKAAFALPACWLKAF